MRNIFVVSGVLVLFYLGVSFFANTAQLASAADRIHLGFGQYVFWLLTIVFTGFVALPVVLYFRMPKALVPPPVEDMEKQQQYMVQLRDRLRNNPRIRNMQLEHDDDVAAAIKILSGEADKVLKKTANIVFVSTAVMHNGKMDGLITLVTQARMVWQISSIYNQRPSPQQIFYLYSNVGIAALLAQSIEDIDFAELVAPIVVSMVPSLKGAVPGLQGISDILVNSLSGGATNALITLRIGFVAKQYCETLSAPARHSVRKSATIAALALIGDITRENSKKIAEQVWNSIKGSALDAADTTVARLKEVGENVAESTSTAARKMAEAVGVSVAKGGSTVSDLYASSVDGAKSGWDKLLKNEKDV